MEGALNDWRAVSKRCGLDSLVSFGCKAQIGVKKIAASKISGFVWAGPKGNVTRDDSQRRFLA